MPTAEVVVAVEEEDEAGGLSTSMLEYTRLSTSLLVLL